MTLADTRSTLQRVAAHVAARRRFDVTGRFGLRPAPGGLTTPAFGPDHEVVRISGDVLVHEVGGTATWQPITGATMRQLAGVVGVDLAAEFSCGGDTPALGDLDEPLALDAALVVGIAGWWAAGVAAIDAVVGAAHLDADPSTLQLWPEHFDAATAVTVGGVSANLGVSAGDGFSDEPYCYVGPWASDRPGDPAFWNAPFGAVTTRAEGADLAAFFARGLALLAGG